MECNREEAVRALEIAEKKLGAQDYNGAHRFLQKALQLFPNLDNAAQLSCVLGVHIAAQKKINGVETDWYGILQVDPGAEDMVIKKQYKKLALLLHPDKNKSLGAESAFKLIGEALQVLSDKQQRSMHDSRRKQVSTAKNVGVAQRNQSKRTDGSTKPANKASSTFMTMCPACRTIFQYFRVYENQNLLCHQCRIPFIARELSRVPSNGNSHGYGTGAANGHGYAFTQQFNHAQPQGFNAAPFQSNLSSSHPSGTASSDHTKNAFREKQPMDGAPAQGGVKRKRSEEKQAEREKKRAQREQQQKERSERKALEALERMMMRKKKKEEAEKKRRRQKKRLSDSSSSSSSDDDDDHDEEEEEEEEEVEEIEDSTDGASGNEIGNQETDAKAEIVRRSSRARRKVTYKIDASDDDDGGGSGDDDPSSLPSKNKDKDKPSQAEGDEDGAKENQDTIDVKVKEKLANFFKGRIQANLNLHTNTRASEASENVQRVDKIEKVSPGVGAKAKPSARAEEEESFRGSQDDGLKKEKHPMPRAESKVNALEGEGESYVEDSEESESDVERSERCDVPDPEFHDFDKGRKESDVSAGQIWAAYDKQGVLPRYYFKVREVKSRTPFRVSVAWLELHNMSAQQVALKKLGYQPVCGSCFRESFTQEFQNVESFSHVVRWEKAHRKGMVKIYPREGQVWALYKDWEPRLGTEGRQGDDLFKHYDMVEVLSDFDEETGVSVSYLAKLDRHRTVFTRMDSSHCLIPPSEICRFSFQVPSYKLQGNEADDIQPGFWELDPCSLPRELL